jgi:phosphomannomutase/phosphoglucomutase
VSSGRLIEDVAKNAGANIVWTEVGSVVVSHKLEEIGAELGGEENGGVFYPPHQSVRDGPLTAAQIVEIIAVEGKSLSQLVSELPGPYYSNKTKVEVPPEKKDTILDTLLETTKDSGTEPVLRCFTEGNSQKTADLLAKKGVEIIKSAIKAV